ncbi:unnamed protein product, partial [Phaeothamnion confervicola]
RRCWWHGAAVTRRRGSPGNCSRRRPTCCGPCCGAPRRVAAAERGLTPLGCSIRAREGRYKAAIVAASLVASASAFVSPSAFTGALVKNPPTASSALTMAVSDMLGADVETGGVWDPLGLSGGNLYKYREAELKHGRVAMLAVTGQLVQGMTQLPDPVFSETKPLAALSKIYSERPEALWQILLACGAVEFYFWKQDPSRAAGDIGGPSWIRYSDAAVKKDKLTKELKNGRLAMIAIFGEWAQELVTGQGPLEQLAAGHTSPFGDGQGFF